ncbi:hypothetical protein ABPG72_015768 [Tetrahymena utriculariae]
MEPSNNIALCQENQRQVSLYQQDSAITSFEEDTLKNETRTIPQLQAEVLNEYQQTLSKYQKDKGDLNQKIMQSLKKTKSAKDLLHNLLVMLPQQDEIQNDCEEKRIYDSIEKNGTQLKKITNQLEKLSIEVQSIMKTYRQKLESFKGQIQAQIETSTCLTKFIETYCNCYFKEDIKKIQQYKEKIEDIDTQIDEIQNDENILKIHQITRRNVSSDLMDVFFATDTQIINNYDSEIQKYQQKEKNCQNEIFNIAQDIEQIKLNVQQNNYDIDNLKQAIKIQEKQQQTIQTSLENDQDQQQNIEKLYEQKKDQLENYKNSEIQKLKNYQEQFQINLEKEYQTLLKKQQNSEKIGKNYNLILLIDDSGSMHSRSGFFSFLKQTPYEILKESIYKFVEMRKSQRCKDKISVIKFSDKSIIMHRKEQIENIRLNLDQYSQRGGTNFNCGFKDVLECVKETSQDTSTIFIFQTDGQSIQKDQCKEYIRQMKEHDPNMQMFTLAIGDDIDETFLKSLTKYANGDKETFNKDNQNTMNYYQQLIDAQGLSNVISNISLGISEQMKQIRQQFIQQQQRFDQLSQEYNKRLEKFQSEIQSKQDQLDKDKQAQLKIRDEKQKQTYLKQQQKEIQKQIEDLNQQINQKQQQIAIDTRQVAKNEQLQKEKQKLLDDIQKDFDKKKYEWKQEIEKQIALNEDYRKKMQDLYKKTGCSSELKLRLWAQTTVQFDQFIYILSNYTSRFKNFYQKFQSISENLQQQTNSFQDGQNPQMIEEQQIKSLTLYFSNLVNGGDMKTQLINAQQLIKKIFKQSIYLRDNDTEKQAQIDKFEQIILSHFENLENMLKEISFNNPNIKKIKQNYQEEEEEEKQDSDNEDKEENKTLKKILEILKKEHDNFNGSLIEEIEDLFDPLIKAKVIKKQEISKIKNKQKLDKMIEKIEDYFDNFDGSSDKSDEEKEDDSENDNEKAKKKNMKKKKPKIKNKMSKLLQSDEEQSKLLKQFKEKAKKLIKIFGNQKDEIQQLKKCWNIIDSNITKVLSGHNLTQKQNQIHQLCTYLDQEMIQPLGALLEFQEKSK